MNALEGIKRAEELKNKFKDVKVTNILFNPLEEGFFITFDNGSVIFAKSIKEM